MKKACSWIILAIMVAGIMMPVCANAIGRTTTIPKIILYTYYRQVGWGDRVQIGCVDEKGGIWATIGNDSELKWPYKTDEQLAYLQSAKNIEQIGQLTTDELFDLKGLIASTPDQGQKTNPAANDAGTEKSYVVEYDQEGTACFILLGASGDDCFENTDPNAQALYRTLRELFPMVTHYGYPMGPGGFQPVMLRIYCNIPIWDFDQITITASQIDCEAGPSEVAISDADRESIIRIMKNGIVTGKANATSVTGGTYCISFSDKEGNFLGGIELYKGLLVRSDGMYLISVQEVK